MSIGVRAEQRRRGVGRALVSAMDAWMAAHDVREVWVLADNPDAVAFDRASGLRVADGSRCTSHASDRRDVMRLMGHAPRRRVPDTHRDAPFTAGKVVRRARARPSSCRASTTARRLLLGRRMRSWSRARLTYLLAGVGALTSACGDDPKGSGPEQPAYGDEKAIRAAFDAWKPSLLKECSVDAAFFPDQPRKGDDPPQLDLDATATVAALHGTLWLRDAAGETVIFGAPERPSHFGFSNRDLTVLGTDGAKRQMVVSADLSVTGVCVIEIDHEEAFRGQLWGRLPIAAHLKPGAPGADLASDGGPVNPYEGSKAAYVEMSGLNAVATALTPDLDRAKKVVANTLKVGADAIASRLGAPDPILPYVEADDASAPFAILGNRAATVQAIPFLAWPVVPVAVDKVARWAPAKDPVTHTLHIVLPRPSLDVAGYLEGADHPLQLDATIRLEPAADDNQTVRVTAISAPRAMVGGDAQAASCFTQISDVATAYVAAPEVGLPSYRIPIALVPNGAPAAASQWLTVPCSVWTADLSHALRGQSDALARIGTLLDSSRYANHVAGAQLAPREWDRVLADLGNDDKGLAALEGALSAHPLIGPGLRTQRRFLGTTTYTNAATHQRAMRTLLWHASMVCAKELTDEQIGALFGSVENGDFDGLRDELTSCPWH